MEQRQSKHACDDTAAHDFLYKNLIQKIMDKRNYLHNIIFRLSNSQDSQSENDLNYYSQRVEMDSTSTRINESTSLSNYKIRLKKNWSENFKKFISNEVTFANDNIINEENAILLESELKPSLNKKVTASKSRYSMDINTSDVSKSQLPNRSSRTSFSTSKSHLSQDVILQVVHGLLESFDILSNENLKEIELKKSTSKRMLDILENVEDELPTPIEENDEIVKSEIYKMALVKNIANKKLFMEELNEEDNYEKNNLRNRTSLSQPFKCSRVSVLDSALCIPKNNSLKIDQNLRNDKILIEKDEYFENNDREASRFSNLSKNKSSQEIILNIVDSLLEAINIPIENNKKYSHQSSIYELETDLVLKKERSNSILFLDSENGKNEVPLLEDTDGEICKNDSFSSKTFSLNSVEKSVKSKKELNKRNSFKNEKSSQISLESLQNQDILKSEHSFHDKGTEEVLLHIIQGLFNSIETDDTLRKIKSGSFQSKDTNNEVNKSDIINNKLVSWNKELNQRNSFKHQSLKKKSSLTYSQNDDETISDKFNKSSKGKESILSIAKRNIEKLDISSNIKDPNDTVNNKKIILNIISDLLESLDVLSVDKKPNSMEIAHSECFFKDYANKKKLNTINEFSERDNLNVPNYRDFQKNVCSMKDMPLERKEISRKTSFRNDIIKEDVSDMLMNEPNNRSQSSKPNITFHTSQDEPDVNDIHKRKSTTNYYIKEDPNPLITNNSLCKAKISININEDCCTCKTSHSTKDFPNTDIQVGCHQSKCFEKTFDFSSLKKSSAILKDKYLLKDYEKNEDYETQQLLNICRKYLPKNQKMEMSNANHINWINKSPTQREYFSYSQIPVIPSEMSPKMNNNTSCNDVYNIQSNNHTIKQSPSIYSHFHPNQPYLKRIISSCIKSHTVFNVSGFNYDQQNINSKPRLSSINTCFVYSNDKINSNISFSSTLYKKCLYEPDALVDSKAIQNKNFHIPTVHVKDTFIRNMNRNLPYVVNNDIYTDKRVINSSSPKNDQNNCPYCFYLANDITMPLDFQRNSIPLHNNVYYTKNISKKILKTFSSANGLNIKRFYFYSNINQSYVKTDDTINIDAHKKESIGKFINGITEFQSKSIFNQTNLHSRTCERKNGKDILQNGTSHKYNNRSISQFHNTSTNCTNSAMKEKKIHYKNDFFNSHCNIHTLEYDSINTNYLKSNSIIEDEISKIQRESYISKLKGNASRKQPSQKCNNDFAQNLYNEKRELMRTPYKSIKKSGKKNRIHQPIFPKLLKMDYLELYFLKEYTKYYSDIKINRILLNDFSNIIITRTVSEACVSTKQSLPQSSVATQTIDGCTCPLSPAQSYTNSAYTSDEELLCVDNNLCSWNYDYH